MWKSKKKRPRCSVGVVVEVDWKEDDVLRVVESIGAYGEGRTYRFKVVVPVLMQAGSVEARLRVLLTSRFKGCRLKVVYASIPYYFEGNTVEYDYMSEVMQNEYVYTTNEGLLAQKQGTTIIPIRQSGHEALEMAQSAAAERAVQSRIETCPNLPLTPHLMTIVRRLNHEQVVGVEAGTGSGKSTLIPFALLVWCKEFYKEHRIVVAMPRRMTVLNVYNTMTAFVDDVGYKIGGAEVNPEAQLLYVTTGHLLKQLISSHSIPYRYIVLDECHLKTAELDLLCAVLQRLHPPRVLLMSATFPERPRLELTSALITAHAQPFPVTVHYLQDIPHIVSPANIPSDVRARGNTLLVLLKTLCTERVQHDENSCILVFVYGMQPMDEVEGLLGAENEVECIRLHSLLPGNYSKAVSAQKVKVRVIVSTNTAELGVTLGAVDVVVDSCLERTGQNMSVGCITKQSAVQRSGRVGRCSPGTVYRLITNEEHQHLRDEAEPELEQTVSESVVLDVLTFAVDEDGNGTSVLSMVPGIESHPHFQNSLSNLETYKAVMRSSEGRGYKYTITDRGVLMQQLPLDPVMSYFVLQGASCGMLSVAVEAAVVVTCMHVRYSQDVCKASDSTGSDVVAAINLFRAYTANSQVLTTKELTEWCHTHALNPSSARETFLRYVDVCTTLSNHDYDQCGPCGTAPLAYDDILCLSMLWAIVFSSDIAVYIPAKLSASRRFTIPAGYQRRYTLATKSKTSRIEIEKATECKVTKIGQQGKTQFVEMEVRTPLVWGRPYSVWIAERLGVGETGLKGKLKRIISPEGRKVPMLGPVLIPESEFEPPEHWPPNVAAMQEHMTLVLSNYGSCTLPCSIPGLLTVVLLLSQSFVEPRTGVSTSVPVAVAAEDSIVTKGTNITISCCRLTAAFGPRFKQRFKQVFDALGSIHHTTQPLMRNLLSTMRKASARPDGGMQGFHSPYSEWRHDASITGMFPPCFTC